MLITRIADDFVFTAISLLKSDKSTSCLVLILTLIISSVCKYNEKRKIAGRKTLIRLGSTSKPSSSRICEQKRVLTGYNSAGRVTAALSYFTGVV